MAPIRHFFAQKPPVERAKAAERVRGEERLAGRVIRYDHFRPVHHLRGEKLQRVPAGGEAVAILHQLGAAGKVRGEELLHHVQRHSAEDKGRARIAVGHFEEQRGVVWLHVAHHHIVQRAPRQGLVEVFKENFRYGAVRRVKQHGLFVQQHIGIVRHAFRHGIMVFKAGGAVFARADPNEIIRQFANAMHLWHLLR